MFKNAFVLGAGAGAGSFAGVLPQMLLGALLFYIGSSMKDTKPVEIIDIANDDEYFEDDA